MAGFGKTEKGKDKLQILNKGSQYLALAVKAQKKGDIKNAESLYLKAIDIGFHHEIALSNLGVIYKNTGRKEEAIKIYELAISINPNHADAYSNLGNLFKDLGNLDQALAATLKSLELKPGNPDVYMNLGGIYKELGQIDQAIVFTVKSLEIKPTNHYASMNLGAMYFQNGKYKEAVLAFEDSLSVEHTSVARLGLSMAYCELGNNEEGLKHALGAVALDNNNEDCLLNLAKICAICDSYRHGIDAAIKVIELNERSEKAYLLASTLLCKEKLFANARQILEKGRKRIKNSHILDGELIRVKFVEELQCGANSISCTDDDVFYEDCGGTSLIISFGSMGHIGEGEKHKPKFDFRGTLKSFVDYDKLFVRDLDRCYYMNGIRNSAPSILELVDLIMRYVRAKHYKSITTLGSSSGGFGALLYGNLIKADYMIAFNPQTVLDQGKEAIIKDDVFSVDISKRLRDASISNQFYRKCLDLRNFIPFEGKAVIHYSSYSHSGIDKRYAEYLQHENCSIIASQSTTHLLAFEMKEKNVLVTEIAKLINMQENQVI